MVRSMKRLVFVLHCNYFLIISNSRMCACIHMTYANITSSDSNRKRAWPKLVGIHNEGTAFDAIGALDESISATIASGGSRPGGGLADIAVIDPINLDSAEARQGVVARCLDAKQIDRDIARCTWHLLTGSQRQRKRNMAKIEGKSQRMESLLKKKQRRLGNLINLVLVQSYANDDDEGGG